MCAAHTHKKSSITIDFHSAYHRSGTGHEKSASQRPTS